MKKIGSLCSSKLIKPVYSLLIALLSGYVMDCYIPDLRVNHSLFRMVCMALIFAAVFRTISKPYQKRIAVCAAAVGLIFSVCILLGHEIVNHDNSIRILLGQDRLTGHSLRDLWGLSITDLLLRWISLWLIFATCIYGLYSALIESQKHIRSTTKIKKRNFFFTWAFLFVCWIPYFFALYPGTLTTDSLNELRAILGITKMANHHPVIHQWTLYPWIHLGQALGALEWGVALCSLVQMVLLSALLAAAVYLVYRKTGSFVFSAGLTLFLGLFPINGYYSVTMWKDVLFGGLTALNVALLFWLTQPMDWSKPNAKLKGLLVVISLFFFCIYRNNGYYAFIIAIPVVLWAYRKHWKRILAIASAVLILVNGYYSLLFDVLKIEKSSSAEMLSVPLQQIARTVTYAKNEIRDEEWDVLYEIFPEADQIPEKYLSWVSDPMKSPSFFRVDTFRSNPVRYARLWASLLIRCPSIYVEAFLCQNVGYWYPNINYWKKVDNINENEFGLERNEKFASVRKSIGDFYSTFVYTKGLALYVWIILLSFGLLICKKQYKLLAPFAILLGLWATTLFSPVFCEFRYVYGLILSASICAATALAVPNLKDE